MRANLNFPVRGWDITATNVAGSGVQGIASGISVGTDPVTGRVAWRFHFADHSRVARSSRDPITVDLLGRERTPIAIKLIAPPWRSLQRGAGDFFGRELLENLQPPPGEYELSLATKMKHRKGEARKPEKGRY